MASQVRKCSGISEVNPWWAVHTGNSITSISTVEQFEESCAVNGGWRPNDEDGIGVVLRMTASRCNSNLVSYIIREKGGKAVLNRGNGCGQTALFYACQFSDQNIVSQQQVYETVDLLLQHGADPNLAAHFPGGATPLWAAACRVNDFALCRLLLLHGAQLGDCPLSFEGRRVLAQAQAGLADYRAGIHGALDDSLLSPLADIVAEYAGAPPSQN